MALPAAGMVPLVMLLLTPAQLLPPLAEAAGALCHYLVPETSRAEKRR